MAGSRQKPSSPHPSGSGYLSPLLLTRPRSRCERALWPEPGWGYRQAGWARPWLGKRGSLVPPNPHVTCWRQPSWLVRTRPASAPHWWFAGAKHVRRGEMVPGATLADLDHIHPEFAIFGSHLRQFRTPLDPSCVLSEFVSVHICDVCDVRPTAYGAAVLGRLAVVLGRPQEVRMRVAHVGERGPPGLQGREGGAPGERVIHNGTTCGHASSVRRDPWGTRGGPLKGPPWLP